MDGTFLNTKLVVRRNIILLYVAPHDGRRLQRGAMHWRHVCEKYTKHTQEEYKYMVCIRTTPQETALTKSCEISAAQWTRRVQQQPRVDALRMKFVSAREHAYNITLLKVVTADDARTPAPRSGGRAGGRLGVRADVGRQDVDDMVGEPRLSRAYAVR